MYHLCVPYAISRTLNGWMVNSLISRVSTVAVYRAFVLSVVFFSFNFLFSLTTAAAVAGIAVLHTNRVLCFKVRRINSGTTNLLQYLCVWKRWNEIKINIKSARETPSNVRRTLYWLREVHEKHFLPLPLVQSVRCYRLGDWASVARRIVFCFFRRFWVREAILGIRWMRAASIRCHSRNKNKNMMV